MSCLAFSGVALAEVFVKKIDLHMHTVATASDSPFVFSMERLSQYVEAMSLDAIAITNHNTFDATQYRTIVDALSIPVFPGIEVDVESCHILVIVEPSQYELLDSAAQAVSAKILSRTADISADELLEIFSKIENLLMIPHYDKKPAIRPATLSKLSAHITAGEVDSAKKFVRNAKSNSALVPVLFSDVRISETLSQFPTRHTFIDCGDLCLSAIKACLRRHDKVALSERDGNRLFQVLGDGLAISTGLNILLGDRSSGKTFTLNQIYREQPNTKYIKQFSLVQQDEATYERDFTSEVERQRSRFTEDYLTGFKTILDDIVSVDLAANDRTVGSYIETLVRSAEETDRADAYSKAALFSETRFKIGSDNPLKDLIASVRQLIENVEYSNVVRKHVDPAALRALSCELIETLWGRALEAKKKNVVNGLVNEIRQKLGVRSSAIQVDDVDLYQVALDLKKVERFENVVKRLRIELPIFKDSMQGFKIVARKGPYTGAGELKALSRRNISFKKAMGVYEKPYCFLQELVSLESIPDPELYRYFAKITYDILNKDGYPVSGGERSEFRLLQEISDAQNYDILLIDEPESSFDNMFLKSDVNAVIREISRTMPVIVVTHNSTVAVTVGPDYVLFARKERGEGRVTYKIYCGFPTDKRLVSVDGTSTSSHSVMMNSLEAGQDAYRHRRESYETIEN
jgi:hypothetical protein